MSFLGSMPAITAAAPAAASSMGGGGMSPGLSRLLQSIGGGMQQMNNGQMPPMPDLLQQGQAFDPLQFLQSLGPRFQPNMLGQLGQM